MGESYEAFIATKSSTTSFPGIETNIDGKHLFPHQRDLARWALRKGRAAIFADTGLGKSIMELEWARHVAKQGRVLMMTPLAVGAQTVRESEKFGYDGVKQMRRDDGETRIVVSNYENLQHFDASKFVGIVLDESSILKSLDGRTRTLLIDTFKETPFRLCATATPAPNDFTELGNHSQFLGIKTHAEMLAEYFVHDMDTTQEWRLKGHAQQAFWKWLATWGAVVRSPADLGYDDSAYRLPPLRMHDVVLPVDHTTAHAAGTLFAVNAVSLTDQRAVRRATLTERAARAAAIATSEDSPCLIWCELNEEQGQIAKLLGDSCYSVQGKDSLDDKESAVLGWTEGSRPFMVSKSSIIGFGLNFQHCSRMVFVGASHSYEGTYQSVRRCWRFGQTRPVDVYMIRAETEQLIVDNYRRKEADAARLGAEMASQVLDSVRAEIQGASSREWNSYDAVNRMETPPWLM